MMAGAALADELRDLCPPQGTGPGHIANILVGGDLPHWTVLVDAPCLQTTPGLFDNALYGVQVQIDIDHFDDDHPPERGLDPSQTRLSAEWVGLLQGDPAVLEMMSAIKNGEEPRADVWPCPRKVAQMCGRREHYANVPARALVEAEYLRLRTDIEAAQRKELEGVLMDAKLPKMVLLDAGDSKMTADSVIQFAYRCTKRPEAPPSQELIESRHSPDHQYVVKTLTGKQLMIGAIDALTIGDFKKLIEDKEGFPPDQLRLIARGIQLDDERTLSDYNLRAEWVVIHIVLRLRGECTGVNPLGLLRFLGSRPASVGDHLRNVHETLWGMGLTPKEGEQKYCHDCRNKALNFRVDTSCKFNPEEERKAGDEAQWYFRCASPSALAIWTPETDKYWPFLFRKIVRYCLQIRIPSTEHHGGLTTIPHDVVSVIGSYL